MSPMKVKLLAASLFLVFIWGNDNIQAQTGYSSFVENLITGTTDSSLALINRQLSGDTTVFISGVLDSIKTRAYNMPGNHKAAQFILQKFQSFGLSAELQHYDPDGYNVVATKLGTVYPDQQFIICAHYDDRPYTSLAPGADDNASGVSAVIEAARLMSGNNFDYTLKFITFDDEEIGLWGSRAYSDTAYKYGAVIKGVINLDMIAWDGNNDYEMSVGANETSMPLLGDFMDVLKIYVPQFSPHLIIATSSDHYRFWLNGYHAIHAIEEFPGDFNPNYHQVTDNFDHINRQFFLAATKGAIAALATLARDYRMTLGHVQPENSRLTADRTLELVITSPHPVNTSSFQPRLYYNIDNGTFNFLLPSQIIGNTYSFIIPGQMPGNKISYYFAAQDDNNEYTVTLPEYGKGTSPPGTVTPTEFFSYYILNDTVATVCASGLPLSIPAYDSTFKTINVTHAGRLLDLNVNLSILHTYDKEINLFLISPSGREVVLSTKNGTQLDNYTSTVFDDEATVYIQQGRPPYTGSFKPEQSLSAFDDTLTTGIWTLKIINVGPAIGTLTDLCLLLTFDNSDYYVDAALPFSGNGRSWPTAFKTISEAASASPGAGSVVFVKPGEYNENVFIASNGQEIVPLTTGIEVSSPDTVKFPAGTDLSGIDLVNYPGEFYTSIFRSLNFNNGNYQVRMVNDPGDYILVDEAGFYPESGVSADSSKLSAIVFRPVIYRKYAINPLTDRVIIDAGNDPLINHVLYIGDSIGDGSEDANPANFNIIDGIDITGSTNSCGIRIQGSSFNIIQNSRIFELDGNGIQVIGNEVHPALYNLISGSEIFNTGAKGISIGIADQPEYYNQGHFTHFLNNDIHTSGSGIYSFLDKAVDINHFNKGSLLEGNILHDFELASGDTGAVEIGTAADLTVLNGNIFKDIGRSNPGVHSIIRIHEQIDSMLICNNIIYDSIPVDNDLYAFTIDATNHINSLILNNTIYNLDNGFILEDNGASSPEFGIHNNIIHINSDYFLNEGIADRYQLSHNYYNEDPAPLPGMPYYAETGRQIGPLEFVDPATGNFRPTINNDLILCNGLGLAVPVIPDPDLNLRDNDLPDIGAYELENKIVWTGQADPKWSTPGNWNKGYLPLPFSNAIILPSPYLPVLDLDVEIKALLLKNGTTLLIPDGMTLMQNQ
jgi:hypothetical protein